MLIYVYGIRNLQTAIYEKLEDSKNSAPLLSHDRDNEIQEKKLLTMQLSRRYWLKNPLQITASCDEIEMSSGLQSQEPIATCKRIYLMNFPENVENNCNRVRGAFPVFDPHERCSHIDT